MRTLLILALAMAALSIWLVPGQARAAQSYDACTGFIDTVPTTINSQGVWCLRSHLSTNITSGAAININANNVTIDCNDFRVGGLAAGPASETTGILATNRLNITVRNCNVRGFLKGIDLEGAGHLVQDNRLDNNLHIGIRVNAETSIIRRNQVIDTGGTYRTIQLFLPDGTGMSAGSAAAAITSSGADVIDNAVDAMFAPAGGTYYLYGILSYGWHAAILDNRVRDLQLATAATEGGVNGIYSVFRPALIRDNLVARSGGGNSNLRRGIYVTSSSTCMGNTVAGFTHLLVGCSQP